MEDVRGRVHMEDEAPSSPPHESKLSSAAGQSQSSAPLKMSFSLGKAAAKKKTEVKMQEELEEKEERISVSSLKEAHQLAKPKKVDVTKNIKAIPLITKNHWIPNGIDVREANGSGGTKVTPQEEAAPEGPLSLEEEAARALLKDAVDDMTEPQHEVQSIPLLIQNSVPGMEELVTEEDKFRHDVRLRPESSTLAEYMNTPVEDYGVGMLMGMGWKPGDPIGLSNKQVVEPMEFLRRGRGLGLGADEGALPGEQQKKKFIKPGESREGPQNMRVLPGEDGKIRHFKHISDRLIPVHSMRMRKDALVEFTEGKHTRMYGRVTDFDGAAETATKINVRLNLTGQVVPALRYELQILDAHALPKDHPALVIGALKKKEKKRKSASRSRSSGSDSEQRSGSRSRSRSKGKKRAKKEKKDKKKKDKKKDKTSKEDKNERITWVRPNILVRVVSQKFEGGVYYNLKGRVEDVVDSVYFTLVINGKRVDEVKQKYVESALPKAGGKAMVLRGEHKGSVGLLLERNAKMQKAVVQFEEDMNVATLSFDDLAEYAPR